MRSGAVICAAAFDCASVWVRSRFSDFLSQSKIVYWELVCRCVCVFVCMQIVAFVSMWRCAKLVPGDNLPSDNQ